MRAVLARTVVASLFGFCLLAGVVSAQERIESDRAQTYAFVVADQGSKVKDPNVKTEVDPMKACAVRISEHVALVIPDKTLTKEQLAKVGKEVMPVGQLWFRNAAPAVSDKAPAAEKLRVIEISTGDGDLKLPLCFLGVQKNDKGDLELLVFGKEKEPLVKQVLKKVDAKQELPIELEIKPVGDAKGELTINLLGGHSVTIPVAVVSL